MSDGPDELTELVVGVSGANGVEVATAAAALREGRPSARRRLHGSTVALGGALVFAAAVGTVAALGRGQRQTSLPLTLDSSKWTSGKPVSESKLVFGDMSDDDIKGLWQHFTRDFGRSYGDDKEDALRFEFFKKNLQEIDSLNSANPHALFGITKFADFSSDERQQMRMSNPDIVHYASVKESLKAEFPDLVDDEVLAGAAAGGARFSTVKGGTAQRAFPSGAAATANDTQGQVSWASEDDCAACERFPSFSEYNSGNMPDNFDWRALGAVGSVHNQKYCGSCWSFSAAQDIEGAHYLAGGELTERSEQQFVACDTRNMGCDGGWPFSAMQYVSHFGGLVSSDAYPYKGICAWDACEQDITYGTPTCDTELLNEELAAKEVAHVEGFQFVALGAEYEDLMRVYLLKNGPLSLAFNANGMDFYVHGIAGCTEGVCDAGGIDHHTPCDPDALDHAVLAVGYGVQTSESQLSADGVANIHQDTEDVPYWLIKNSWGEEWGEDGYYRLLRGNNVCGVANMVVHSVVKKN